MLAALQNMLLDGNGHIVCAASVIAVFVILGLTKRTRRRCPRCHTLNRPPARFCAECGAKLSQP